MFTFLILQTIILKQDMIFLLKKSQPTRFLNTEIAFFTFVIYWKMFI